MDHATEALREAPRAIHTAFVFLTRLPLPRLSPPFMPLSQTAWAWPIVGITLGGIAGLIATAVISLGGSAWIAAISATIALILLTGALHEDGLADLCDGFWGGHDRERRLEIMRDSRVGSYGVIGLIGVLALRIAALAELGSAGVILGALLASEALSRSIMGAMAAFIAPARTDGLSKTAGQPSVIAIALSVCVSVGLCFLLFGASALWILLTASTTGLIIGMITRAKIGGQTGDVLGATQCLTSASVLVVLSMISG